MTVIQFDHTPLEKARDDKAILTALIGDLAGQGHRVTVLGMPAFLPEWMEVPGQPVSPGDEVEVRVIKVPPESKNDYGAFVNIGDVPALLHRSELSWTEKEPDPRSLLKVGDRIKVKVVILDRETKKMAVSLREMLPNPWDNLALAPGYSFTGTVIKKLGFGVLVALPEGMYGILHSTELTESRKGRNSALQAIKIGDSLPVVVKSIDRESRKIDLELQKTDERKES